LLDKFSYCRCLCGCGRACRSGRGRACDEGSSKRTLVYCCLGWSDTRRTRMLRSMQGVRCGSCYLLGWLHNGVAYLLATDSFV
jgi:hypothetical protein